MPALKLPVVLLVLSVTLNQLRATPDGRIENARLDKRVCNTATCATHRLASFLLHSSHTLGALPPATNVGSNTYGKRGGPGAGAWAEPPPHHLPL
ncbi:islet amyloid polypeptide [Dipodomys spectabilis]|uniref:islet amyloid polypeptide n=1 Tax=Dipodomys spectabilis TaxID=105255 RepID=UPI001C547B40|nr:islet amyloid polypeptide [Dipodomys spectabilis]